MTNDNPLRHNNARLTRKTLSSAHKEDDDDDARRIYLRARADVYIITMGRIRALLFTTFPIRRIALKRAVRHALSSPVYDDMIKGCS